MRLTNPMPTTGTNTLYDLKADVLAKIKKDALAVVKKLVEVTEKPMWEAADEARKAHTVNGLTQRQLNPIYIEAYEKALGIKRELMSDADYTKFRNQSNAIYKITFMATSPSYETYRMSGRSFNACWLEANGYLNNAKKKKLAKIAKGESSKQTKEELEKEADDGVANAREYADNTIERAKPKSNKKETKSWSAPPVNLDKELKEQMRKLLRGEKIVFLRMIVGFAEVSLLSEKWKQLALEEMEKLV